MLSVVLLVGTTAGVFLASELRLRRIFVVSDHPGAVDLQATARGAHLYRSIGCATCHGDDGGGMVYLDAGPIGLAVGTNLTAGKGGIGARRTARDLRFAIRSGVRPDGTSLLVMPSEVYAHLTQEDLEALVAYLRALPPIDRALPPTHLRPLGRALLATGRLDLRSARKAELVQPPVAAAPGPTASYGRYLADIASCRSCHRAALKGGPMMAPGAPAAPDITPGGLPDWRETDFTTLMRTGRRPDGSLLHPIMPWTSYRWMTDDELQALWRYLRWVPASAAAP
jgi:mono/diheme cytochrome c family protein